MADKSVDKLFDDIIKDYKAVVEETVYRAAISAKDDIIFEAHSCLRKYYNNYKPRRYKRTKSLQRAIVPIFKINSTRRKISFRVGVQYDSSRLEGIYKSNSRYHQSGTKWKSSGYTAGPIYGPHRAVKNPFRDFNFESGDNGVPEPEWILNNFLTGVHPWAATDLEYSDSTMSEFFDDMLPDLINGYIEDEFVDVVYKRLGLRW